MGIGRGGGGGGGGLGWIMDRIWLGLLLWRAMCVF